MKKEKELKVVIVNPEVIPEAKKKFTKLVLESYEMSLLKKREKCEEK